MSDDLKDVPRGGPAGFARYLRYDLLSGFLVFLIALPLCLGISLACGYPPMAGIFTAIIGAILTTFISNSEMTIKGPAAGLIVIAIGCIEEFGGGHGFEGEFAKADFDAYRMALAVGVVAAALQIAFGLFRAGILSEFFPSSAVHGMLAAIGVIIIAKQFPVAMGVIGDDAKGEPLELLEKIPHFIKVMNPEIAMIGIVSMLIMFLWPVLRKRLGPLQYVPAPMIVLVVAIPMGLAFNLMEDHPYSLLGRTYEVGETYLVKMPDRPFGMFDEITLPDFSGLSKPFAWKWVFMFFIIGTLESVLSAKAVDLIDPWKRKTSMDRDILAVGIANLLCAFVGGLPMISEIVRSRANIDNGARTRFADMWHGVFLLTCVALIPMYLHWIPLAALAAMLVYTGYRLAHPSEFVHVYHIGREQLVIFVSTLVAVLATDLLIGIAIGIGVKMLIHVWNGVPMKALFKTYVDVHDLDEKTTLMQARESAVFSNWIPFRRQIEEIGFIQHRNLIVDLSNVKLVDHSVMEKLGELKSDFEQQGLTFEIRGLDELLPFTDSAHAARKRALATLRRLTVVADTSLEQQIKDEFARCGATGYTSLSCSGAGRRQLENGEPESNDLVRIEVIAPGDICDAMLKFLRRDILPEYHVTACVERVEVVQVGHFTPRDSNVPQQVAHT